MLREKERKILIYHVNLNVVCLSFFKLKGVQMVKSACFIPLKNVQIFKGNVKCKISFILKEWFNV